MLAGCHSETLKLHLSHNNVIFLEDEAYREHSFEETLAIGLTGCAPLMERVLVLPVEYPACADSTIKALLAAEKSAVPTYDGQEGWPRSMILSGTEMDPTEKINFNFETGSRFLPTEDPGVTYSLQEDCLLYTSRTGRRSTGEPCLKPVAADHGGILSEAGDPAVSYTHLDVYKRQEYRCLQ